MILKCDTCGADPAGRWLKPAAMLWRDPHQGGKLFCYSHLCDDRKAKLDLAPSIVAVESVERVPVAEDVP
jgi:hypothetical protein